MTDPAAIATYLDAWFRYVDWPGLVLEIRGVGEKGTPKEGTFVEPKFIAPAWAGDIAAAVEPHVRRWSEHGIGSFIVPAALGESVNAHKGGAREEDVVLAPGLLIDIDKGDTDAAMVRAEHVLGRATLVVRSGGTTGAGYPKRHVYWRASEPTSEVDLVARLRKHLALALDGDAAFGRRTQIIRIPGSIHGKNGNRNPVLIERCDADAEISLEEAADRIMALPLPEGAAPTGQGVIDFSGGAERAPIGQALVADIAEGGEAERNRWSEFSRVAGWNLHIARQGAISLYEAADQTRAWMEQHMHPAWPEERFRQEFSGLVRVDVEKKGPFPEAPQARSEPLRIEGPDGVAPAGEASLPFPLAAWAVQRTMHGPAPVRRFLVKDLLPQGKPQLMVAAGGVGKTWALLQLGMAVVEGAGAQWFGSPVAHASTEGHAVLLVAEDDREEMHSRIASLDPTGEFRAQHGARLIVLPLPNIGGAFSLVELDAMRNAGASRKWREIVDHLAQVPNLLFVGIDTYSSTLHGEENAAVIANEWFRTASEPICGRLGASLVVTHHVRKEDSKAPINTIEDMKAAIRGTTALPNNFRSTLGLWPDRQWKKHLPMLGLPAREGALFKLAVLKTNNPEMMRGERVLVRGDNGGLMHPEGADRIRPSKVTAAAKAWLLFAVQMAAGAGHPFTISGRGGLFVRKGELPPEIQDLGRGALEAVAKDLVSDGSIRQNAKGMLDTPDGKFSKSDLPRREGAWTLPRWDEFEFDDQLNEVRARW